MKLVRENIEFKRGIEPKKSLKVGKEYFEDQIKELQARGYPARGSGSSFTLGGGDYVEDEDFNDGLIDYLWRKTYKKWLEKPGKNLGDMIFKSGRRKGFHWPSINMAYRISDRLIELMK